ncbi:MAG: isoaspartyl peptidase/L-asparaginase [Deltaproteobacteria bacterium]|nr:isoaspartyl peptidase/L-asparaginase [Deltaproteobacteria bacterium]
MPPALIVHGGAGRWSAALAAATDAGCARAADAGWAVLRAGGSALAAVLAAVEVLEDDPLFNAGIGACLAAGGQVELDASVMDGATGRGAGVAGLTTVRHPIRLAAALLDASPVLLAGAGAEAFARRAGLATGPPEAFVTARQRRNWIARTVERGTVGAVAVDRAGRVAAATSTGGLTGKLAGRIGDSAVIGAGTYASAGGAASATGPGEAIILAGLARVAVDQLDGGADPERVAAACVGRLAQRPGGGGAGLIVVDRFGRIGSATSAEAMPIARRSSHG